MRSGDEKKADIIALILEGKKDIEVAKIMKVHRGYVYKLRMMTKSEGRLAGRNVG